MHIRFADPGDAAAWVLRGTVSRADIAAVAQRADADAHDALHLLGDFHGAVFAVGERAHVAGGAVVRFCAAGWPTPQCH